MSEEKLEIGDLYIVKLKIEKFSKIWLVINTNPLIWFRIDRISHREILHSTGDAKEVLLNDLFSNNYDGFLHRRLFRNGKLLIERT